MFDDDYFAYVILRVSIFLVLFGFALAVVIFFGVPLLWEVLKPLIHEATA